MGSEVLPAKTYRPFPISTPHYSKQSAFLLEQGKPAHVWVVSTGVHNVSRSVRLIFLVKLELCTK